MATEKKQPEADEAEFMQVGEEVVPGMRLRCICRGHTKPIGRIAWSPDGRFIASPSRDKTIRIWDAETGECLVVLEGHEDAVNCVAWSPGSKTLASASSDKTVRLWDAIHAKSLKVFRGHTHDVFSVAWSRDGRSLISGSMISPQNIVLWDPEEGEIIHSEDSGGWIVDIATSPKDELLAFGSMRVGDYKVLLWNLDPWRKYQEITGFEDDPISVVWSSDGNTLVSGLQDNSIRVINISTCDVTNVLEGHTDIVHSLCFLGEDRLLASKSLDKTIRLWDTTSWSPLLKLEESSARDWRSGITTNPDKSC